MRHFLKVPDEIFNMCSRLHGGVYVENKYLSEIIWFKQMESTITKLDFI